jgi:hypothetical protein
MEAAVLTGQLGGDGGEAVGPVPGTHSLPDAVLQQRLDDRQVLDVDARPVQLL